MHAKQSAQIASDGAYTGALIKKLKKLLKLTLSNMEC